MSPFVLRALIWLPVALVVAAAMDLWAALLHGRVWHSWLWRVHRSHHEPRPQGARFEINDALSVLHAPIAIALILFGCTATPGFVRELGFGIGVGMTLFGMAYVVVHDGLVHGRLPVRFLLHLRYFRGVARAHRVHHTGVAGGAPYGLFFARWELRDHQAPHAVETIDRASPRLQRPTTLNPSPRAIFPHTAG